MPSQSIGQSMAKDSITRERCHLQTEQRWDKTFNQIGRDNVIQTITVKTYLSGKHKQCDEEDKEGDRAHSLQVFENSWSSGADGGEKKIMCL